MLTSLTDFLLIFYADSSSESDTFIGAVQKFMETSTLGEFPYRLYILDAFEADMLEKGYLSLSCHMYL